MSDLDELAEKVAARIQPPRKQMDWGSIWNGAPAWIMLLVSLLLGYSSISTRISTLEIQAQQSITERADLKRRLDKSDEVISEVKSELREIRVILQSMAEKKK